MSGRFSKLTAGRKSGSRDLRKCGFFSGEFAPKLRAIAAVKWQGPGGKIPRSRIQIPRVGRQSPLPKSKAAFLLMRRCLVGADAFTRQSPVVSLIWRIISKPDSNRPSSGALRPPLPGREDLVHGAPVQRFVRRPPAPWFLLIRTLPNPPWISSQSLGVKERIRESPLASIAS